MVNGIGHQGIHPALARFTPSASSPQEASTAAVAQHDPEDVVTIANYNVENLFAGPPEPGFDEKSQPTKSDASYRAVARVIEQTEADVLALQEVHDDKSLQKLLGMIGDGKQYPYSVLVPGNDPRGINVAVISKFPITEVRSHADDKLKVQGRETGFSRDFLEATIDPGGKDREFTVGVTHLKAHSGGEYADAKRLAEGKRIRDILTEEMRAFPNKRYVVCGDFNDQPGTPAVEAVKSAGLTDNLGDKVETHPVTHRRIDYMLASKGMQEDYVPGSMKVLQPENAREASDHLPIVGKFAIDS